MNKKIIAIVFLWFVVLVSMSISTLAQKKVASEKTVNTVTCENNVIVQADDWLSKIAEKVYGDVLAFPIIVEATNVKAILDNSYTWIEDPDIIEIGWKLCISSSEDAQIILETDTLSNIRTPKLIEYNTGQQFVWEWEEKDEIGVDWYFDIKIYRSSNDLLPYDTLVADPNDPQKIQYSNGKWYSELRTNFVGCSYWAVQIAKRDAFGNFEKHISLESERMKAGLCESESTFSSPVPEPRTK